MNNSNFPAWHNGKFCRRDALKIDVHDFGLLRSYGVYDVITIKNGRALAIDQHINRLLAGCKHYHINMQYTASDLINVIKKLNQLCTSDIHIWITVTRGVPNSLNTKDILHTTPQVMLTVDPYRAINEGNPMKISIARTVRRIPDSSIDQRYKNFARQDFTMAQIEIATHDLDSVILLDHDDLLTEGPQFSIAIVKDGCVLSPAKNRLPGITMNTVKTLCEEHKINFEYCDITEDLLNSADDMFATSTAGGVISIASVDSKQFVETPLQQKLKILYQQAWEQDRYSTRI
jgi:branched-chain amino acid aminotransferase